MLETAGRLEQDEEKAMAYLHEAVPEQKPSFPHYFRRGRLGVMQRLLQAAVREQVIPQELISWKEGGGPLLQIRFPSGTLLQARVSARYSLGRFDLADEPVLISAQRATSLAHPLDLLDLLEREGVLATTDAGQLIRFRQEVANGTANYVLALAGAAKRFGELAPLAAAAGVSSSLEWVERQMAEDDSFSPLVFYEQCVAEGHPLHPGTKTKLGFAPDDVVRFTPDWGAEPELAVVAVARTCCRVTSLEGERVTELLRQEYPGLWTNAQRVLADKGLAAEQFELMPVHPWQLQHTLPALYAQAMQKQLIVPLDGCGIPASALLSFRSFAPLQRRGEGRHHIKTAVQVQATSAVRLVSPQSAENGPVLSRLFRDILKREPGLANRLVPLEERSGVYYNPPEKWLPLDERGHLQANLAAILRENPETHVREGELPVVAAALIARSPFGDRPIVLELVDRFAEQHAIPDRHKAAVQFVRQYAETALPGFVTLMVRYGIGLEGHMQNCVAVFRQGELVRMIVRDFGGVRLLPERLERQGLHVQLYPGSSIVSRDVTALRGMLAYSVMQNHVAELIAAIVRALGTEESRLWQPVREVCRRVFAELKRDPLVSEQAAADEEALFQPMISLKTLMTMRLKGEVTGYAYQMVPNPLCTGKGEAF